jgi:deoxyhypusine synthase
MRLIIAHLIEHRYIDCLVSTGRESLSRPARDARPAALIGSPTLDDAALAAERIDRVYEHARERDEFCKNDEWIRGVRPEARAPAVHHPRVPLQARRTALDRDRQQRHPHRGVSAKVPIFCPAIADSSIGMGLSQARQRDQTGRHGDVIGDIIESANIVIRKPSTATIVLGGGRRRTSSTRPACRPSSTTTASAATSSRFRS